MFYKINKKWEKKNDCYLARRRSKKMKKCLIESNRFSSG